MARTLGALAARVVGRRVRLRGGHVGTVVRVNGRGLVVTIHGVRAEHVESWEDD